MHTFEFDLPRGLYEVTVSVGWAGRTYKNHLINVNGVEFFNVEQTNATVSYMNRSKLIYCYSNKLFLEMGDGVEYTMLNYLIIKLVDSNVSLNNLPQERLNVGDAPVQGKILEAEENSNEFWNMVRHGKTHGN